MSFEICIIFSLGHIIESDYCYYYYYIHCTEYNFRWCLKTAPHTRVHQHRFTMMRAILGYFLNWIRILFSLIEFSVHAKIIAKKWNWNDEYGIACLAFVSDESILTINCFSSVEQYHKIDEHPLRWIHKFQGAQQLVLYWSISIRNQRGVACG